MRRWPLAALLALAAAPASAQVVIGGAGRPSVEVDLSAIHGGGAPSTGLTPGYDRPLLIPPADEAPKLTPPRRRASKPAPVRKPSAKPVRSAAEPKPEPTPEVVKAEPKPEPSRAAPAAPPPPSAAPPPPPPAAAAPPVVAAAPPAASAPAPFPPAPSAPVASIAPPPPAAPPQAFSSAPAGAPPQSFAPAPPKALAPAEPAAEAPRPATRMAALPPADGDLMVEFQGDGSELAPGAAQQLRALAARLKDQSSRLQLKAYASGGEDGPSRAKRISLSRGLAVRSFLIDQGMRSTQIDVRALGLVRDGGPEDRVDIVVLEQ